MSGGNPYAGGSGGGSSGSSGGGSGGGTGSYALHQLGTSLLRSRVNITPSKVQSSSTSSRIKEVSIGFDAGGLQSLQIVRAPVTAQDTTPLIEEVGSGSFSDPQYKAQDILDLNFYGVDIIKPPTVERIGESGNYEKFLPRSA